MEFLSADRNKLFICSSRADREYLAPLQAQVRGRVPAEAVEVWDEARLAATNGREEFARALSVAKMVLLLVSPDALSADFLTNPWLFPLLEAARRDAALVRAVVLRPCAFEETRLAHFPTINPPSRPVSAMKPPDRERLWKKLAAQVQDALRDPSPGATFIGKDLKLVDGPHEEEEPEAPPAAPGEPGAAGAAAAPGEPANLGEPAEPAPPNQPAQPRATKGIDWDRELEAAFEVVMGAGRPDGPQESGPVRDVPAPSSVEPLRFTAFYPKAVAVETWNTLLVYAHLAAALGAVQADAARFTQEKGERPSTSGEAEQPIPGGIEVTIVPQGRGLTFNPARISVKWLEDWHQALFRFQAERALAGSNAPAQVTIYAGPLILATIPLALACEDGGAAARLPDSEATARPHQLIFPAYSHQDVALVRACREVYTALGLEVLADLDTLRAGQEFHSAIRRMIEASEVFQLFWSRRSAESLVVRQEWEYALNLRRDGFIRPVYWQLPPVAPPALLASYQFTYITLTRVRDVVAEEQGITCFRCGVENPPGKQYCVICHYDLSTQAGTPAPGSDADGQAVLRARLTLMDGPFRGRHFNLHQDALEIGRSPGNDIMIGDPSVSRQHARLRFEAGHWVVEDKNSSLGTYVNGRRIRWPQPLTDGDQLRLAHTLLIFSLME